MSCGGAATRVDGMAGGDAASMAFTRHSFGIVLASEHFGTPDGLFSVFGTAFGALGSATARTPAVAGANMGTVADEASAGSIWCAGRVGVETGAGTERMRMADGLAVGFDSVLADGATCTTGGALANGATGATGVTNATGATGSAGAAAAADMCCGLEVASSDGVEGCDRGIWACDCSKRLEGARARVEVRAFCRGWAAEGGRACLAEVF